MKTVLKTTALAAAFAASVITPAAAQNIAGLDLAAVQRICQANPNACQAAIAQLLSELSIVKAANDISAAEESTVLAALSAIAVETAEEAPFAVQSLAAAVREIATFATVEQNERLQEVASRIIVGDTPSDEDIATVFASAN